MEPPPGPCSSPPGPRPVPPPRRGSVERRSLSPLKRGGEHPGAWEAAGDGSAWGPPERATVTQRVLIVMESHASAPPATSHGASVPKNSPTANRGAPSTSTGGRGVTVICQTTPKSGAPPSESTRITGVTPSESDHRSESTLTSESTSRSESTQRSRVTPSESTPTSGVTSSESDPRSGAPPSESTWITGVTSSESDHRSESIPTSGGTSESTPRSRVTQSESTPTSGVTSESTPTSEALLSETTRRSGLSQCGTTKRSEVPLLETTPRSAATAFPVQNQNTSQLMTPEQNQGDSPSGSVGHSNIQNTPITSMRLSSHAMLQDRGVSSPPSGPVQNQPMSPRHETESRGTSQLADGLRSSSEAPSNPDSPQGTQKPLHQDMGVQEGTVCGVTLTDGSDKKSLPAIRPEDVKSLPAIGHEDVRSFPAIGHEDVRSLPANEHEDVKSAIAIISEDMKSTPTIIIEDGKSAPAVGQKIVKNTLAVRPEEAKSVLAVISEDVRDAPALEKEEGKKTTAVKPEDVKITPTIRPEDVKSSSAAQSENMKSALAVRPEAPQSITTVSANSVTQQEVQEKQDGGPLLGNITQTQVNPNAPASNPLPPSNPGWSSLSPVRVPDPSSPHRNISSKPPLPIPPRSNLYPGHPPREPETSAIHETASLSSFKSKAPAPDTLSYLDSVSLMSGTMESLTLLDDASSLGSDSEINGMTYRKTDKYGFLGGNQFSGNGEGNIPVEIARQRELKWLDMFNNWDKWLTRRFQKVKLRCRKGIPSSLRAKAWQFLSNSHELLMKNPGKFEEMERQHGDPKWLDVIEKDLHRQFPFHEMFAARGGHGQQDLYRILKAYTVYRPEEGYCQAQAPVAAVLLMHMPAEQAFWCLVQICDKYLPGYYSAGLEAIQLDGEIFFALLRRVCPMAYRHLKKFKIDPILYMTEWFMCIFSRTLPWASVLRVWDMFFCEGVKIVFRVGLVLLKHTLGSVDKLRSCQGMYETMEKLRSLPVHCMQEDVLLPEVSSLPVTDALIERESNTQLRKWRENRGELQYRPSRRLHGAKQIYEEKLRLNPTLSGSRLSLSSLRRPSPPATPALAVQPESMVVSEGLRPVLPSPTSNKAPLGPPKEVNKKGKEKQREQEKKREKEEREREKKREKEEREERRKEREREKQKEKEEKRVQKEKEKAEVRPKKERKFSFRRKESSSTPDSPRTSGPGAADSSAAHDTYF